MSSTGVEGDIKQLPLEDASFDVAIDKGGPPLDTHPSLERIAERQCCFVGTMDALMTTKGDVWDPPAEVVEACKAEVDEVVRCAQPYSFAPVSIEAHSMAEY